MAEQGVIRFTVPGVPAPQGSKVRTQWGMREDNPATRPWRNAVAWEAANAMNGRDPFAGPLELSVAFYFPRPKAHYGTGRNQDVLKQNAPHWHATKPDADKLARAIGDAITGVICRDDSQIAYLSCRKLYGTPSAVVTVRQAAL